MRKPYRFEYDKKLLSILSPREQWIVSMYFGLDCKNYSLKEISKKFEVSTRTIAKYRDIALLKLNSQRGRSEI